MADAIVEEIKRMIESGELKEGEKLPNQADFASQLNVSRTSLREALRVLDLLGAIEQRPGFGTVIKKYNPVTFSNRVVCPPLMSDAEATLELLRAREIIEVGAARLAADNASKQQVETMTELITRQSTSLEKDEIQTYIEMDIEFHQLIAESSSNRFILYSFQTLKGYIRQYMQECFGVLPGMLISSEKLHRAIFRWISARDPDKAAHAMQDHIRHIQKYYSLYQKNIRKPLDDL